VVQDHVKKVVEKTGKREFWTSNESLREVSQRESRFCFEADAVGEDIAAD